MDRRKFEIIGEIQDIEIIEEGDRDDRGTD